MASALAMDKTRSKYLWSGMDISTAPFVSAADKVDVGKVEQMGLPLFVKPAHEGSSVGMTKVTSIKQLHDAVLLARKFDSQVLIEKFIDGGEYTVAILNGKAMPVICVETPRDFYDYKAKYELDSTSYHCPCGLDGATEKKIQALALEAYHALGCRGWGRVDVMMDSAGNPYVLEANTVPGMTDHSLVPMAAKQAGIEFSQLAVSILETSYGT